MKPTPELTIHRRFLAISGGVYLLWWFAVVAILPDAFNPFLSRIFVVLLIYGALALTYFSGWAQSRARWLSMAGLWLITAHYYYLFFHNGNDINWIVGAYITVIAISHLMFSSSGLIAYSLFVLALSLALEILIPSLQSSVFLPGLLTLLFQANLGLHSRNKMIKTLEESNQRFRLLFNSTFEGVMVLEKGRIIDVNDSIVQMTGYSREELIGKQVLDVIHPSERDVVKEKMKFDEVPAYETKGIQKDGSILDIEVRAKNFKYDNRDARLVTAQNISDRKHAEQQRIHVLTLAENIRVRDEFISIASHELKTPLSSLIMQVSLIERDVAKGKSDSYTPEKLSSVIGIFQRQIHRLTELVDTMLDVSRISTGRLVLDYKSFDLTVLVRDVALQMQDGTINLKLPNSLPISADRSRIQQVLENLLSNALKYGNKKPIQVELSQSSNEVVLSVKDLGIGIGSEYMHKIFERFERAISARNISGLGLGLYITRQIVEAHGGQISVESQLHQGSTFRVSLPIQKSSVSLS